MAMSFLDRWLVTIAQDRGIIPAVKKYFFESLSFILFIGSLGFFYECIQFLSRRDYVAATLLMFIGFAVIRVGAELARLALIERQ